jgi:diadenylate cyclase
MLNSLLELSRNMRIADLFDIGILSFVAYSAIVWFLRTTSRLVVIGMVVLALVYFAARTFDLYLTSLLFQAFFAVFVVAMVVVFQEEIRRGFERIAIWGTFRDRRRLAGWIPFWRESPR